MTLRRQFLIYLTLLHGVFAVVTAWFLRDQRVWLLGVEILFVFSFAWAVHLLRRFFGPLELIRSGATLLREGDFTIRFTPSGHVDMDQLVDVYNRMVDSLREERIHNEEQEHLLQKVMKESPGGVITLDMDGNVATINPTAASLLGAEESELVGRSLAELGTPFASDLMDLPLNESTLLTLQGRRRVRCHAATFMDRGFSRRFLLLDELTQELHRSEKDAYEQLIRMMSHEVNNTSGAVQSLLQSCLIYRRQLADGDREDFGRAMEVAIQRTAHLDTFMRGFADVVRLPKPQLQPCDPWEIASQVGLLFRDRLESGGVSWKEERAPSLPAVLCDPVQLEQVLVNVIKNACESIDANGGGGEILIRGGRRGSRCYLTVADTGSGLDAQVEAQLFNPFYTTRENGQGIGLTMTQEILLSHGFDFALENREDGGAEFTIVF